VSWEETPGWMFEEQDMVELDAKMRKIILDYQSKYLNTVRRPAHVKKKP
jgi:hypothetical protein